MITIDDALTSVRKADWRRLVCDAADGETVQLSDPHLPQSVVLDTLSGPDEYISAVSHGGSTRGAWTSARAATWLRGRAWTALTDALTPDGTEADAMSDDCATALGLLRPLNVPLHDVDDLTAAAGRSLLRELAGRKIGRSFAALIRDPRDRATTVALATMNVWQVTAVAIFAPEGPDSPPQAAGLWLKDIYTIILAVGHAAWVAEQSGRPWSATRAADEVLAAADRVGIPI